MADVIVALPEEGDVLVEGSAPRRTAKKKKTPKAAATRGRAATKKKVPKRSKAAGRKKKSPKKANRSPRGK